MPKLFSLGAILSIIGIAYVSHTVYTFYNIYFPAWCSSSRSEDCINPRYFCDKSDLIFQIWISRSSSPPDKQPKSGYIRVYDRETPCETAWEENVAIDLGELPRSFSEYYIHVLVLPKLKGKTVEIDILKTDNPNVAYQKTVVTKMLEEERTAINLIRNSGGELVANSSKKYVQSFKYSLLFSQGYFQVCSKL